MNDEYVYIIMRIEQKTVQIRTFEFFVIKIQSGFS